MIEVTRLLALAAMHVEHGVNAQLALVPRENGRGGADAAPPAVTVYNDADDESVANEVDPPVSPALVLFAEDDFVFHTRDTAHYEKGGSSAVVAAAYITKDMAKLDAVRNSNYTLRAFLRTMRRFNSNQYVFQRALNGVTIAKIGDVTLQQARGAAGLSEVWGFALVSVDYFIKDAR